jgi:beta-N-acetylhexosaminidase
LAAVFGCRGAVLSDRERALFREAKPYGLVVFKRNCETPDQLRRLIAAFREAVGRADAPVLIDQEGGRVNRLKPPHWPIQPAPARFGALAARDAERAERAVYLNARVIAATLGELGIGINAAPVLDLPAAGADPVIGDRAFAEDPALVARLGRAACNGYLDGSVLPIIKHLPGHGRATADSHKRLPVVDADRADLEAHDFRPFKALADMPWAMTAHIVYTAIDPERPATQSPEVVGRIIRGAIGFDGVLITDDLCMGALTGGPAERALAALAAGCDIALHCSGDLSEMAAIAAAVPPVGDATLARLARGEARRRQSDPVSPVALRAEVDALLAMT